MAVEVPAKRWIIGNFVREVGSLPVQKFGPFEKMKKLGFKNQN